jgi:hypothetical protein
MNKLLVAILVAIALYYLFKDNFEKFQITTQSLVDIPTMIGNQPIVYNITTTQGKELVSSAFTPIMCNDWILNKKDTQLIPPVQRGWALKKVTDGVYIFEKPQMNECLYTFSAMNQPDSLRSYTVNGNCNKKNLCGSETVTYKGTLDEESSRTYFRLVKAPTGNYIISIQNNKYVCLDDKGISFKESPDTNCQFNFSQI